MGYTHSTSSLTLTSTPGIWVSMSQIKPLLLKKYMCLWRAILMRQPMCLFLNIYPQIINKSPRICLRWCQEANQYNKIIIKRCQMKHFKITKMYNRWILHLFDYSRHHKQYNVWFAKRWYEAKNLQVIWNNIEIRKKINQEAVLETVMCRLETKILRLN